MEEILARLKQHTASIKDIDAKIDALLALDSLTKEQEAEYAKLKGDREKAIAAIAREKEKLAREEQRAALEAENEQIARRAQTAPGANRLTNASPATVQTPPPTPGLEDLQANAHAALGLTNRPTRIIPAGIRRVGRLRNFQGTVNGLTADERAFRFGMWGLAMLSRQMPGRFNFREAVDYVDKEMAAVSGKDASGYHYLVPEEFGTDIIVLREQYGVVRRLFKVVPMQSDTRTDPRRTGGLTAYFPGEGSAGTESSKTWDDVRLTARDLMVLSRISNQVRADTVINWGDDLAGEIAYAFANKEDDCGLNGDGTSTYGGIVGARPKIVNVSGGAAGLVQGAGGTWASLVLADFETVAGKLPQYADTAEACWVAHRAFYYTVMLRLELAAGGTTAKETSEGDRRPRPLFLGYPVEFAQILPGATSTGTIHALLGNFPMAASLGDRQQNSIAFSEHATIGGENVFERNQIAIRGTERMDIQVHDVGDSTNPGPIVALKTA